MGRGDLRALSQYEGKNYVLALALSAGIDLSDPKNLDLLFSPSVPAAERPGPEAYAEVTLESLKTKTFPHLTSYEKVGEMPRFVRPDTGTPILVDRSLPDTVLVFFSNGSVQEVSREEFARY